MEEKQRERERVKCSLVQSFFPLFHPLFERFSLLFLNLCDSSRNALDSCASVCVCFFSCLTSSSSFNERKEAGKRENETCEREGGILVVIFFSSRPCYNFRRGEKAKIQRLYLLHRLPLQLVLDVERPERIRHRRTLAANAPSALYLTI